MEERIVLPAEVTFAIDFNLHWVPAALGLEVSPAAAAAMLGITEEQFGTYAEEVETSVWQSAAAYLHQPRVGEALERLDVPAQGLIMAVGDSITTYRYSYARLLAALVSQTRPDDRIRFLNVAQSGYTTTHGLENTFTQFLAHQPDAVLIMFGVNDCKIFGGPESKTLVTLAEYRANMNAMVEAFLAHSSVHPILLTPTPVIEDIVNGSPDFQAMGMSWRNTDLQARAETLHDLARAYKLLLIDLFELFGPDPDPVMYLADGLHPSPHGQTLILDTILKVLSEPTGSRAK